MLLFSGALIGFADDAGLTSKFRVEEVLDVAEVPADFPVRFCLLTTVDRQYAAYYDKERYMTVASRDLDSKQWTFKKLPTQVGWDTHNYITMALDDDGHLHVSGNMHNVPLIYFRTESAGDIATLKAFSMTGVLEDRVTYPRFLKNHKGELLYSYRHGGSGNGMRIYNRYDLKRQTWQRLMDTPLFDGEGLRNAYPKGPFRGADGWFHVIWVWRDTPDCATNQHLSYARSRDMIHWESVFGEKAVLPITFGQRGLVVDPIPPGGGIINGCADVLFDVAGRPVISYHKSDESGHMQIYAARPENGAWKRHLLTNWDKPVKFGGTGSMGFIGIKTSGLSRVEPGVLTLKYRHRDYGNGRLVIDEKTLNVLDKRLHVVPNLPAEMDAVESDFPGMTIQRAREEGGAGEEGVRYILQWETLGRNRDKSRPPPLPEPGMMKLYKLKANK